jgi:hypothetical protein
MRNTAELQTKLQDALTKWERGKISGADMRTYIGFSRAILDTVKVELAMASLNLAKVEPVTFSGAEKPSKPKLARAA